MPLRYEAKMNYTLEVSAIEAARKRIGPYVRHSPLLLLPMLNDNTPTNLRLKLENLQVSG